MSILFMHLIFMVHSLNAGVSTLLFRHQDGMLSMPTILLSSLLETGRLQVKQARLIFGQSLRKKILFSRSLLSVRNIIQNWRTGFSSAIGRPHNFDMVDHHLSRKWKIYPGCLPIMVGIYKL